MEMGEVSDWTTWEAALDRGECIEDLLGLGKDRSSPENLQAAERQQSSSSSESAQNKFTELSVPGLPGKTLQFVFPVKPFHLGSQKMKPPVSSLSDKHQVTTPFVPLDNLLGPCLYVPPRKKQS